VRIGSRGWDIGINRAGDYVPFCCGHGIGHNMWHIFGCFGIVWFINSLDALKLPVGIFCGVVGQNH